MNHGDRETRGNTEKFLPLTEKEIWLAGQIISIAIKVHKALGPGLLESVYEKCFCYELEKKRIPFIKQLAVPIVYDEIIVDEGLRLDVLVNDLVIIEFKAQDEFHPIWEAQLLSYLKLTKKRLGYILNFHVPVMKQGIKRRIL